MTNTIRFNAFEMNCVGHHSPGLGCHQRYRDIKRVKHEAVLARTVGGERRAELA